MKAVFFIFCLFGCAHGICPEVSEFTIRVDLAITCAHPLNAVIEYLLLDTPTAGACSMYTATDRFNRFREHFRSIGGFVSEKVTFRRGHYVNPITKKPSFSVGGLFLKANEVLLQGETIFYVPEEAVFGEKMIRQHLPYLRKFSYGNSYKFWACIALAALLRYHPAVVGPWQALLPEISYHPQLWSQSDLNHLKGTSAYLSIQAANEFLERGCSMYAAVMELYDLTCKEIISAYALITSRSFAFGDVPSIPFGPDLLNHNPHTASWISRVLYGPSKRPHRSDVIFFINRYVLTESRELFNNYGPHAFASNLAAYGFTAPDEEDELVVVATGDGIFNGKLFRERSNSCPAKITLDDLSLEYLKTCSADFDAKMRYKFDQNGDFRLLDRDFEILSLDKDFPCRNPIGGFVWQRALKRINELNVRIPRHDYILKFNVVDGAAPHVSPGEAAWMTICSMSHYEDSLLVRASQCPLSRSTRYAEEFPLHPDIKSRVKKVIHGACTQFELKKVGPFEDHFWKWIAYRNLKITRTKRIFPKTRLLTDLPTTGSTRDLLEDIVRGKDTVHVDPWGIVGQKMIQSSNESIKKLLFMEEISKFRMQIAYLVRRKCADSLESVSML